MKTNNSKRRSTPAGAVLAGGLNRAMFAPRVYVGGRFGDDGSWDDCWRDDYHRPHSEHTGADKACPASR